MQVGSTWKARPLSPEQFNRMMKTWGKIEAGMAENPSVERVCWYITSDGTAGVTVVKVRDAEAASAWSLEISLALGEFLEFDTRIVLDLEEAMPAITKATERING
jgi:uncharacterized protein DUF3303